MFRWSFIVALVPACIVFNPQSKAIQQAFFPSPPPSVDEASLELSTPAFDSARGFTDHDQLMRALETAVADHPEVASMRVIGTSQRGRDIPLIRLAGANPQIRVFFMGGLHGDEPAGSEGLLLLVDRLLDDPAYQTLLDTIDLSVIPVANPDGFERQRRLAANGRDLNRDQTKLEVPESLVLKRAFHEVDPAVAVDFHEYRPYRRDFAWLGTNGITNPYDVMFLYSGNLNVPAPLRAFTDDVLVANVRDAMDHRGLRHHDYVTTRNVHDDIWFNRGSVQSRSSATHFALANTVSLLVEVRGVALGRDAFERRVLTTLWVAESVLRTAANHATRITQLLDDAVDQPKTVAVVQEPTVYDGTIEAIDLAKRALVTLPVTFRDNLQSTATLTRARPAAYAVLPDAVPDLAEKLEVLGLDTHRLEAPREVAVERYDVRAVQRDPFRYEGQRQQEVTLDVVSTRATLPPGTLLVAMDAPGANVALEVFEPECPNSFVSFGVVRAVPGTSLPFVRVLHDAIPPQP